MKLISIVKNGKRVDVTKAQLQEVLTELQKGGPGSGRHKEGDTVVTNTEHEDGQDKLPMGAKGKVVMAGDTQATVQFDDSQHGEWTLPNDSLDAAEKEYDPDDPGHERDIKED